MTSFAAHNVGTRQLKTHLLIDFDEIYLATGFARLFRFPISTSTDLVKQYPTSPSNATTLSRCVREVKRLFFFLNLFLQLIWTKWKRHGNISDFGARKRDMSYGLIITDFP